MIGIVIGLIFIGMILAVPLSFMIFMGISKSKKQAQEIISTGKIENLKEVDRILKVLNAGQDLESKHLWGQLNELKEKHTKAS